MTSVLEERQLTEYEQEMLELQDTAPDKFDAEFEFMVNKESSDRTKDVRYRTPYKGEVSALIAASETSIEPTVETPSLNDDKNYVSREFVENLMKSFFEDKEKEKQRRLEREQEEKWVQEQLLKELESNQPKKKKSTRKKRSKSTKDSE